ncbi:vanadium-dependent haloperoxidase [Metabacillus litoralis]|uniref:vanadium-dependent haloperoxidase n=1 Tax=Metabacillus litoralis TaxID=152268 RepID=UPI001CFE0517|nr:vanadium-dependent haloperoxidase [Metabacillus litoralis]
MNITHPDHIHWERQLTKVEDVLDNITEEEIDIAKYYGTGVATKQWTPVIDRLIDSYGVSAPHAARILAITEAAINDAFIVAWALKYKWLVARPNQYNPNLETILCTPRHPTYPSGHATISGCAEEVLSYFFPGAKGKIHQIAEADAKSRLYAGVHFPVDNDEGLKLGRQIGKIVANHVSKQVDDRNLPIDKPYRRKNNVQLTPPSDYRQVIPYAFSDECQSLIRNRKKIEEVLEKPKLYI